jgi:hypothetical protein
VTATIRTIVEPYPATPARHGLLAAAYEAVDTVVGGPDPNGMDVAAGMSMDEVKSRYPDEYDRIMKRWEIGGYSITPENCVEIDTWDPDCANWDPVQADGVKAPAQNLSDAPTNEGTYEVAPYTIETSFQCDAAAFQVVDYRGRAERQLVSAQGKATEFEFWTGTLNANNPHLDSGATVLGGGAAFPVEQGLFLLGQYLSNVGGGGIGMIHAPTAVVDEWLWAMGNSIKEQGDRLRTVNRGDIIVSGAGYPGTGPDGLPVSNGQAWIYATNIVTYRLGEITVLPNTIREALDRKKNDIEYTAMRQVATGFDPCRHAAVLVQTSFAESAGGSS